MSQQQSSSAEPIFIGALVGGALYVGSGLIIDTLFRLEQTKLMPYGFQWSLMIPVAAVLGAVAGWSFAAQSRKSFLQAKVVSLGGGLSIGSYVLWLWNNLKPRADPTNFIILGPLFVGVGLLLLWGIGSPFRRQKSL